MFFFKKNGCQSWMRNTKNPRSAHMVENQSGRTGGAESDGLLKKKLTAAPLWERCICSSASRHGGIKNGVADAISYWKFTFEHVRCLKKSPVNALRNGIGTPTRQPHALVPATGRFGVTSMLLGGVE